MTIKEVESLESTILQARDVAKRTLIEVSCGNAFGSASEAIEKVGPSFGVALSRIEESSAFAKQFVYEHAKEHRG